MRTTILPSMLDVLSFNYNHKTEAACMYEMGTVYTPTTPDKLPIESQKVTIGMYGNGADFFALKGIVEKLLDCLHVDHYDVEPVKDNPTFHPARCWLPWVKCTPPWQRTTPLAPGFIWRSWM